MATNTTALENHANPSSDKANRRCLTDNEVLMLEAT